MSKQNSNINAVREKKPLHKNGCILIPFGLVILAVLLVIANMAAGFYGGARIQKYPFHIDPALGLVLTPGKDVNNYVESYMGDEVIVPWKGLTYRIKVNSRGFRGPEINENLPDKSWRIICSGDGSTFGLWVEEERTYVRRFEQFLNGWTSEGKFESVNLGLIGRSSYTGLLNLKSRGMELKPKIVVISFGSNDSVSIDKNYGLLRPRLTDKEKWPLDGHPGRWVRLKFFILNGILIPLARSDLNQVIRGRLAGVPRTTPDSSKWRDIPRVSGEDYSANLTAIAKMSIDAGAMPIFIAFTMKKEYKDRMEKVAAELNAPFLEDERIYKKHWEEALNSKRFAEDRAWSVNAIGKERLDKYPIFYFRLDAGHPSPLGHELIAQELANLIYRIYVNDPDLQYFK